MDPDTTHPTPMVSLAGVEKSFPDFHMGPVGLEVEPGYVAALVGPNGYGKSTLFRMLLNLAHPDAGRLRIFGLGYPDNEIRIKRDIGYVPDVVVGADEMTPKDLGTFTAYWYPSWDQERYTGLLKRFEIPGKKRFTNLSKGLRRRLSFAVALATQARLLVLDEPTDGIDPLARRMVLDEVADYVQDGQRSVLFSTHVVDEVRNIADYVAFMHEGSFLGMYEKDDLMQCWKALWVDHPPDAELPGVVSVQHGSPARLVSRSPVHTRDALREQRIEVVRTAALDLDEILGHLVREHAGVAGGRAL